MGVHLNLAAIADCNIEVLLEKPRLIWSVISNDTQTANNKLAKSSPSSSTGEFQPVPALLPETYRLQETLGEYWHMIHYLMCKEVWNGTMPEAFLLNGGTYVGDIDMGYGPARVFDAEEVRVIAQAILDRTPADLAKNFDAPRMMDFDIYPGFWDDDKFMLDVCLQRFKALQHFLRHAVEDERGLVVYLTQQTTH